MRTFKYCIALFIGIAMATVAGATINPNAHGIPNAEKGKEVNLRAQCSYGKTRSDIQINNVRARLGVSGDIWWRGNAGGYIVPKVAPGVPEVSSIYAGGIWIGGKDQGGNLKVAAATFPTSASTDWFPGPLDPNNGTVTDKVCANWDRQFRVSGANIEAFKKAYAAAPKDPSSAGGKTVADPNFAASIPEDMLSWPSKGNPYFAEIAGFPLPDTDQGLAYFYDNDGDGDYNPISGDYPVIYVKGCPEPQFPDEMLFWIYNDAGGVHTESGGIPIRMEVQVQAFAYSTNDELNNMTFTAYRLINRAAEDIKDTYFAVFTDPDLGCYTDDYVGCDTTVVPTLRGNRSRDLMYIYNQDKVDGQNGCSCPSAVNTYCNDVPVLGIDYFRGPSDPDKFVVNPATGKKEPKEIGMTSFMYFNNGGVGSPPSATTDPSVVQDYYNYLQAIWKDGTPLTIGGSGYNPGVTDPKKIVKFAFFDAPNKVGGWSSFQENLPSGDRRTLQASGPFRLTPGAVNELIVGVPWVANQGGGGISLADLQKADDKAQELFDKCFDITDGPDAPDLDIIEMKNELILTLTNDGGSNNYTEFYGNLKAPLPSQEIAPGASGAAPDKRLYAFEGYKVYQLAGPTVGSNEINDPAKASLVFQCDIRNGVRKIYNWNNLKDPNNSSEPVFEPELQVDGKDGGITHTFKITEDQFAKGESKKVINHKKYYFTAVAYGYNEFEKFDKKGLGKGQQYPYINGRRNTKIYTAIPHPIVDRTVLAKFGDGAIITRFDGVGTGQNFLDMSDETAKAILEDKFDGKIVYKPGRGPINVKVYNPLDVKDGKFELTMVDEDMNNSTLDKQVNWQVKELSTGKIIKSERTIEKLNEQLLGEFGFSIGIVQVPDAGFIKADVASTDRSNGVIGGEIEYADKNNPWFAYINNGASNSGLFNGNTFQPLRYIVTRGGESDEKEDPDQSFEKITDATGFSPYGLCDFKLRATPPFTFYLTPAWYNTSNSTVRLANPLKNLNNVDVVFTSDKSKWSRCIVVETASDQYTQSGFDSEGKQKQFDVREKPSVGKDDSNGDGLADADNSTVSSNGKDYKTGFAWFPGYAIDVETGTRLNIFFGENSVFRPENTDLPVEIQSDKAFLTGSDMMWNPSHLAFKQTAGGFGPINLVAGSQHFIYVTSKKYDECKELRAKLDKSVTNKLGGLRDVQWAGFPLLPSQLTKLKSYKDGLIPADTKVKLRVYNPYAVVTPAVSADKKGYPTYQFELKTLQALAIAPGEVAESTLDQIRAVPNPYYAYSDYENSQFSNVVKITNLPAKCTVSIYSLDGQFIRQYKRDEQGIDQTKIRSNPGIPITQITPALEWDVKNAKGIPVASGTYLIHIESDLGSRTIKWFGVQRPFDPSGL